MDQARARNILICILNIWGGFRAFPGRKKAPASCEAGADSLRTLPVERCLAAFAHPQHDPRTGRHHDGLAGMKVAPFLLSKRDGVQHAHLAERDALPVPQGFGGRFQESFHKRRGRPVGNVQPPCKRKDKPLL